MNIVKHGKTTNVCNVLSELSSCLMVLVRQPTLFAKLSMQTDFARVATNLLKFKTETVLRVLKAYLILIVLSSLEKFV